MLPGVEVLMLTRRGEVPLGSTNAMGSLRVARSQLLEAKPLAVLFCRERFFCGAWKPTEQDLRGYDDLYIELASFAVK
jgi:hypothetical protein